MTPGQNIIRVKILSDTGRNSVVAPQCYILLCPCVYGLQLHGRLKIAAHYAPCLGDELS